MNGLLNVILLLEGVGNVLSEISLSSNCLQDPSVSELSDIAANLTWVYNCDREQLGKLKIYSKHLEYLHCSQEENTQMKHSVKTIKDLDLKSTSVSIKDLEPNSKYKFTVKTVTKGRKPIVEEKFVVGQTLDGLQQVRDLQSLSDSHSQLSWTWSLPPSWNCELSDMDNQIWYTLKGVDAWNGDFVKEDMINVVKNKQLIVKGLIPFSRYKLEIFTKNQLSEIPASISTVITQTLPSTPPQPVNLRVVQGSESVPKLKWTPGYPPTGQSGGYNIRWGFGADNWTTINISPDIDLQCNHPDELSTSTESTCCCYPLQNKPSEMYQVQAINEGVKIPSNWSQPINLEFEDRTNHVLVFFTLISVVAIVIIIIIVVVIKCNVRSRLKGFKRASQHHEDYTFQPIIRVSTRSTNIESPTSTTVSPTTTLPSNGSRPPTPRSFVALTNNRRSFMDPLPPVPGKPEPIYQEIYNPDKKIKNEGNSASAPIALAEDSEGYLDPAVMIKSAASVESLDEEGYLRPNTISLVGRRNDEEGYLKPTFNRPNHLDTKNMNNQKLNTIQAVSYSSQDPMNKDDDIIYMDKNVIET